MLYVRSARDDRTARAVIRDEALRLFAAEGPSAVSLRQVAAAAGVSPGLIVHHFGSKEGLLEVVDHHVVDLFDAMMSEMTAPGAPPVADPGSAGSLAEAIVRYLPPDSPVPAYLRRLLLSEGPAATRLFTRLFQVSQGALTALEEAGMASSGADPQVRAAFLLVNDLAVLLLRDRLTEVLGVDPLSQAGMGRWAREVLAVYAAGLSGPADQSRG
jgi:AcrR family transcriptional regulator